MTPKMVCVFLTCTSACIAMAASKPASAPAPAWAASTPSLPSVPAYKSLCVPEKETGFNWKSGSWVQANFRPGKNILVQKIDYTANAAKPDGERFLTCEAPFSVPSMSIWNTTTSMTKACYLVKDFGEAFNPFKAEMCVEQFAGNQISKVSCNNITFDPNGGFIRTPGPIALDVSATPKNDYKDSVALTVGTCSKLDE